MLMRMERSCIDTSPGAHTAGFTYHRYACTMSTSITPTHSPVEPNKIGAIVLARNRNLDPDGIGGHDVKDPKSSKESKAKPGIQWIGHRHRIAGGHNFDRIDSKITRW